MREQKSVARWCYILCSGSTVPPRCCSFPFTYNNNLYYRCTTNLAIGILGCFLPRRVWVTCGLPTGKNKTITTSTWTVLRKTAYEHWVAGDFSRTNHMTNLNLSTSEPTKWQYLRRNIASEIQQLNNALYNINMIYLEHIVVVVVIGVVVTCHLHNRHRIGIVIVSAIA